MANTFRSAQAVLGASYADIYTCPGGTTAIVFRSHVVMGSTTSGFTIQRTASGGPFRLTGSTNVVADGAAGDPLAGAKVILGAGEKIQARESGLGTTLTLSIVEIS